MLRVLDLFSGIGGFSLGLKRAGGFQTVGYCEIDPYCQQVLQARMRDGSLDTAPICTDITKLDGKPWRWGVDLICGGFPCQDISFAGHGVGIDGERSGLWRELYRLVCEIRPSIVFVENVPALLGRGLGRVLGDLAEGGYDAEWDCIPARALGAPHLRDRIWIVAYPVSVGERRKSRKGEAQGHARIFADAQCVVFQGRASLAAAGQGQRGAEQLPGLLFPEIEDAVSSARVWRADHGIPSRLDVRRNNAIGNAVVPQVVEWIGRRIMKTAQL